MSLASIMLLEAAIAVMIFVYAAAAAVNLLIPDTGARYPKQDFRPIHTLVNFGKSCSLLWHDKLGQISLSVTTLFWGPAPHFSSLFLLGQIPTSASIYLKQLFSRAWLPSVSPSVPFLAAAYVSLRRSVDVLPIGVLMGLLSVAVMSFYKASWIPGGFDIFGFHISFAIAIACLLLVSVGMMAGFFVVPMNALLQHRGHVLMSAGRSIAVQNFNETLPFS